MVALARLCARCVLLGRTTAQLAPPPVQHVLPEQSYLLMAPQGAHCVLQYCSVLEMAPLPVLRVQQDRLILPLAPQRARCVLQGRTAAQLEHLPFLLVLLSLQERTMIPQELLHAPHVHQGHTQA